MVWRRTRSLVLLILIHGASCQIFRATCSKEICLCGESVTMTCHLNAKLTDIKVEKDKTFLQSDFLSKKLEDGKISIEWTDFKVMGTISEVTFSDKHKYFLHLITDLGINIKPIDFTVSGICDPKISKILETKECVCEAESESNSSIIIWRNNHRYVYKKTKANEKLTQGFKLRSTLKLTEEIEMEMEDNQICCAVIDGIHEEKEVCFEKPAKLSTINSKNSTVSIVAIFLVVALVAVALGYLIKRRNRIVIRAQRLSIAPLLGQEVPGEDNPTIPPLLQPQTV